MIAKKAKEIIEIIFETSKNANVIPSSLGLKVVGATIAGDLTAKKLTRSTVTGGMEVL